MTRTPTPTPFPEPQMIPNSNLNSPKKRHRSGISSSSSSSINISDDHHDAGTLTDSSQFPKPRRISSFVAGGFNDAATADVLLRLFLLDDGGDCSSSDERQIYLHSAAISRAKYFDALLSERWSWSGSGSGSGDGDRKRFKRINLGVARSAGAIQAHLTVLQLLYAEDFSSAIQNVSAAIAIVPVAMKLLFEDCVRYCVRFLEAVPWSEDEEEEILNLAPFLSEDESKELLARVSTLRHDSCERMLHNLLLSAKQNHPNMAPMKAFVARLLRDFSSRDSARSVLEKVFSTSLKVVKDSLEEYSSPKIRGDHNETEAIQRLNLHTALTNGKHLLWLIERMIELRVADMAVKEWSEQDPLAADLQRAFRDDAWRNIVPGLPTVVLKCTSKLASAVADGTILVARQVRMKLVKDWLPVLIVCKDTASPMLHSPKSLYLELEETFLRIISTLPMDDSQELLQQCLSFSTRDSEDCPHLITAFNTWFRRASRPRHST